MPILNKKQELKRSVILLESSTRTLFEKIKSKKFKKRKLIQIESAFLDLIGVVIKGVFKDFNEYEFYCKSVQKELNKQMENIKKQFMA